MSEDSLFYIKPASIWAFKSQINYWLLKWLTVILLVDYELIDLLKNCLKISLIKASNAPQRSSNQKIFRWEFDFNRQIEYLGIILFSYYYLINLMETLEWRSVALCLTRWRHISKIWNQIKFRFKKMKSVFISLKYPSIFLKALYLTKSYFEFSNQQILNTQIILAVDH